MEGELHPRPDTLAAGLVDVAAIIDGESIRTARAQRDTPGGSVVCKGKIRRNAVLPGGVSQCPSAHAQSRCPDGDGR